MPLFRYEAVGSNGKSLESVIDADSLAAARERLRKQHIFVVSLEPLKKRTKQLKLSNPLLQSFTRELSQLLRAGLPLYESLVTIEEKYRKTTVHPLFLDLCDHLKAGALFSSILKRYPGSFGPIYLAMVQVGEKSGNLPFAIECLYQLLTKQQKLKKELLAALTYPALLGVFCFFIVCGLLFFMVPAMQELFEGRPLHPMTATVLALSRWLTCNASVLAATLAGMALVGIYAFKQKKTRLFIEGVSLKLPYVKTLILDSNWVRFFRVSGLLLKGGLPLVETLQLAQYVLTSERLKSVVERAEAGVLEGKRLSEVLRIDPIVPPLVSRMFALAEETGKMGEALENLADIYEEEVGKHLSQLTTYLQPALLILLGAIVGVVILSILLPLTDVSSFLSP